LIPRPAKCRARCPCDSPVLLLPRPQGVFGLVGLKNTPALGVGIAYIVLTAGCFATSDASIKHLSAALPVLVLLWSRYLFQTTLMALIQATRRGWRDMLRSGNRERPKPREAVSGRQERAEGRRATLTGVSHYQEPP